MFDLSLERDRKTVETIQEIFDKFTTDFRFQEMRYILNTQTNEMINMRMNEVAPKWKISQGQIPYVIDYNTSLEPIIQNTKNCILI